MASCSPHYCAPARRNHAPAAAGCCLSLPLGWRFRGYLLSSWFVGKRWRSPSRRQAESTTNTRLGAWRTPRALSRRTTSPALLGSLVSLWECEDIVRSVREKLAREHSRVFSLTPGEYGYQGGEPYYMPCGWVRLSTRGTYLGCRRARWHLCPLVVFPRCRIEPPRHDYGIVTYNISLWYVFPGLLLEETKRAWARIETTKLLPAGLKLNQNPPSP